VVLKTLILHILIHFCKISKKHLSLIQEKSALLMLFKKWWSKRVDGLTSLYLAIFDFADELENNYTFLKKYIY